MDTVKMSVSGWLGLATNEKEMDATMPKPTMDHQPPPGPKRDSVSSQSWTAWSSPTWLQPNSNFHSSCNLSPSCKIPVRKPFGTASMKVYYIAIFKNDARPATELCVESDLSSFSRFMRGSYSEAMGFAAQTVAERTKPGQRQDIEEQSGIVHAYGRTEGVCGIIITDQEYPALVAHQVLSKIIDEFLNKNPVSSFQNTTSKVPFPELKEYLVKYQNPEEADSIMKIQKELDETKIVLHKTIQSVLERGENITKLSENSERLSYSTKAFAKQAQKQNSCCILM